MTQELLLKCVKVSKAAKVGMVELTTGPQKFILCARRHGIHQPLDHCPRVQGREFCKNLLLQSSRLPLVGEKKAVHLDPRGMVEERKQVVVDEIKGYDIHRDWLLLGYNSSFFTSSTRKCVDL
jgi:hypothetical protein